MALNSKDFNDLSVDDFVDNAFDAIKDKTVCDAALIDPSVPGWQITVNFERNDPAISGTQAHEDLKLIRALPTFGYANVSYDPASKTCTISPLEESVEDQFEGDILDVLTRYRLVAHVPDHAKRANVSENLKKIHRYDFETIIITLAPGEIGIKQVIARLTRICAAQNLEISVDHDPKAVSVIISKKRGELCQPKMDFESAKLLDKLGADVF